MNKMGRTTADRRASFGRAQVVGSGSPQTHLANCGLSHSVALFKPHNAQTRLSETRSKQLWRRAAGQNLVSSSLPPRQHSTLLDYRNAHPLH